VVRLRHSVWSALRLLVVASGLLGARACLADAGVPKEMVSGEELAVLKAVVPKICDASCEIRESTLLGTPVDPAVFLGSGTNAPPESMVADYRRRSAKQLKIPDGAFSAVRRKPYFPPNEKGRSCQLSRPGIDAEGQRAMVIVKLVESLPKDVISEGKCVLLQMKDGAWVVERTVSAWPPMLAH